MILAVQAYSCFISNHFAVCPRQTLEIPFRVGLHALGLDHQERERGRERERERGGGRERERKRWRGRGERELETET